MDASGAFKATSAVTFVTLHETLRLFMISGGGGSNDKDPIEVTATSLLGISDDIFLMEFEFLERCKLLLELTLFWLISPALLLFVNALIPSTLNVPSTEEGPPSDSPPLLTSVVIGVV